MVKKAKPPEPIFAQPTPDEIAEENEKPIDAVDIRTKPIFRDCPLVKGNIVAHDHWFDGRRTVPHAYKLVNEGLLKCSQESPGGEKFAGPIMVVAKTVSVGDDDGNNGLVLEFETMENTFKEVTIPRARLHRHPAELAQDLAGYGFYITPGKEKELLLYLGECQPSEFRVAVSQIGWVQTNDDTLIFVLPNWSTDPKYQLQPSAQALPTSVGIGKSGTLRDWIDTVFTTDPLPLVNILISLSTPLLKPMAMPSCGINWHGESSTGKTTLAQMAASVWGGGADPGNPGTKPYINRWNSTRNGLEGLASARNHLPLVLDESGSGDEKDFSKLVYDLSGGTGKTRMDASTNIKKSRAWQLIIISTGEKSSRELMEESNSYGRKKTAKAGAMLRLLDYHLACSPFSSGPQVDKIKASCTKFYGCLGPAFIEAITSRYSESEFFKLVGQYFQTSFDRIIACNKTAGRPLDSVQERSLKLFALAEVSGRLLVDFNLIPTLTLDLVTEAIDKVTQEYMPNSVNLSDSERALQAVRLYILRNRYSKFLNIGGLSKNENLYSIPEERRSEITGYYHESKNCYCMTGEILEEITGSNLLIVKKGLSKFLLKGEKDKDTIRVTIMKGERIPVYGIDASVLDGFADEEHAVDGSSILAKWQNLDFTPEQIQAFEDA
ncbi:MAG: DUF927 domain-containing protein [Cyanobacteria bacterium REEB67]|nr:DUF927 domain-containing protein [Cyanobacteria bacterium REEB67]